jgi:hypothetical protein
MKDFKLYTWSNVGHFDREEHVFYNLNTEKAEVLISGGDQETIEENSKSRFLKDIKKVMRLAKKEIPKLEAKIANNRRIFTSMRGAGNEREMNKAKTHQENNEKRLKLIRILIEKYGKTK